MPVVHVHLGVRTGHPLTLSTTLDDATVNDISADDVFVACNRITGHDADIDSLGQRWQQRLRRDLDITGAPSMSVGDIVSVIVDRGRRKRMWVCEPAGWDYGEVECDRPIVQPNGTTWMGY